MNSRRRFLGTLGAGVAGALASDNGSGAINDSSIEPAASVAGSTPSAWFLSSSAPWVEKLSQPQYEIKFEYQVDIPMRDGIKLRANIWRPQAEGRFPVIYVFTPYDNTVSNPGAAMVDDIGRARYFVPR